jgi:hypothetical protein
MKFEVKICKETNLNVNNDVNTFFYNFELHGKYMIIK